MQRWYLVRTKPMGEETAQSNLERQGYEVYLPRLRQIMRLHQRSREWVCPLFPRYLFLRLDEARQSLKPVHSTFGVTAVVRFGSSYAIVPDEIIRGLMARRDPHSRLHQLERTSLVPGARVRVIDGPFIGLDAVFEREAGTDRVIALLELLGQAPPLRLPRENVMPSLAV